jgi:hypothetical protein
VQLNVLVRNISNAGKFSVAKNDVSIRPGGVSIRHFRKRAALGKTVCVAWT